MGIEATSLVVETFFRSRDRDLGLQVSRQRPRSGQNELESRDHGLEITTQGIFTAIVNNIVQGNHHKM